VEGRRDVHPRGRDIQRETSREVKRPHPARYDRQDQRFDRRAAGQGARRSADRQITKAVEDGDATEAFKLSREIDTTIASTQPGQAHRLPEAQAFAERNSSWFNKPGNEYATARAVELATCSPPRAIPTRRRSSASPSSA
jgi:hypothetical protein